MPSTLSEVLCEGLLICMRCELHTVASNLKTSSSAAVAAQIVISIAVLAGCHHRLREFLRVIIIFIITIIGIIIITCIRTISNKMYLFLNWMNLGLHIPKRCNWMLEIWLAPVVCRHACVAANIVWVQRIHADLGCYRTHPAFGRAAIWPWRCRADGKHGLIRRSTVRWPLMGRVGCQQKLG